jgi:type IV pilus assembly protein PilE
MRITRGFTLVEAAIVCAVSGVLVTLAWPAFSPALVKAGRADAVQALTELQLAQNRHRAQHGLYAHDTRALGPTVPGISPQGLYEVQVDVAGAEGYTASAVARPGTRQAADAECARLTVEVRSGFANFGPSPDCWLP